MKPQTINGKTEIIGNVGRTETFSLDVNNLSHVFGILRSSLYSNPSLAVFREYVSNAVDANFENGYTGPVEVTLPNHSFIDNPDTFIVRDHGKGLSEEQIFKVFCGYGASTKRETDLIGGFGIGSKSAFAIVESFVVTSYYKGTTSTYLCFLDESGLGQVSKLSEEPANGETGLQVQIVIPKDLVGLLLEHAQFFNSFSSFNLKFLNSTFPEKTVLNFDGYDHVKFSSKLYNYFNQTSYYNNVDLVFLYKGVPYRYSIQKDVHSLLKEMSEIVSSTRPDIKLTKSEIVSSVSSFFSHLFCTRKSNYMLKVELDKEFKRTLVIAASRESFSNDEKIFEDYFSKLVSKLMAAYFVKLHDNVTVELLRDTKKLELLFLSGHIETGFPMLVTSCLLLYFLKVTNYDLSIFFELVFSGKPYLKFEERRPSNELARNYIYNDHTEYLKLFEHGHTVYLVNRHRALKGNYTIPENLQTSNNSFIFGSLENQEFVVNLLRNSGIQYKEINLEPVKVEISSGSVYVTNFKSSIAPGLINSSSRSKTTKEILDLIDKGATVIYFDLEQCHPDKLHTISQYNFKSCFKENVYFSFGWPKRQLAKMKKDLRPDQKGLFLDLDSFKKKLFRNPNDYMDWLYFSLILLNGHFDPTRTAIYKDAIHDLISKELKIPNNMRGKSSEVFCFLKFIIDSSNQALLKVRSFYPAFNNQKQLEILINKCPNKKWFYLKKTHPNLFSYELEEDDYKELFNFYGKLQKRKIRNAKKSTNNN